MSPLRWTDIDEIAFQLSQKLPDVDPLMICFTDLHRHITMLPDFTDDPSASNEKTLEAIQVAWLEYYKDK